MMTSKTCVIAVLVTEVLAPWLTGSGHLRAQQPSRQTPRWAAPPGF